MNPKDFDRFEEDDMDEAGPGAPTRRENDRRHRFFRFDPTVSTGILVNLLGSLAGLAIALSVMYSTYREDRTSMLKDIDQVKTTAQRDREDLRASVAEMRSDLRDMKNDLRDVLRTQQQQQRTR
jgi:uncharacterized protein YlxW (UPF0749 family)